MIREIAVSLLAGGIFYYVHTFHAAIVAKLKAETKQIESFTNEEASVLYRDVQKGASAVKADGTALAGEVVSDIKKI